MDPPTQYFVRVFNWRKEYSNRGTDELDFEPTPARRSTKPILVFSRSYIHRQGLRLIKLYRDGVDGKWSSLALRVGSPAQNVRVIVSTNSPQTFVVLPQGCETIAIDPLPSNCANSRGGLFNPNTSTSWQDQGLFGINSDGIGFEANLGYVQNADYGLETVGLGFAGGGANTPTLKNQTVSAIASIYPIYL